MIFYVRKGGEWSVSESNIHPNKVKRKRWVLWRARALEWNIIIPLTCRLNTLLSYNLSFSLPLLLLLLMIYLNDFQHYTYVPPPEKKSYFLYIPLSLFQFTFSLWVIILWYTDKYIISKRKKLLVSLLLSFFFLGCLWKCFCYGSRKPNPTIFDHFLYAKQEQTFVLVERESESF